MPLFSVIIPTYNRYESTEKAIDSVLNQTFFDFEVLVIDDGSTNDTHFLKNEYGSKIKYFRQENSGVSSARNLGIKSGDSRHITFLDSDDLWKPNKLMAHYNYISGHPDIRIHQCDEIWIRNGVRVNPLNKHKKRMGEIFTASLELCLISPSSVCIERSVFENYGNFDKELPACEDYDLWLRVTSREIVGLIDEHLTIKHGGHSDQLSKKFWGMDRFRIYSIIKFLKNSRDDIKIDYMESAKIIAVKKCGILHNGAVKRGNSNFAEKIKIIQGQIIDERYNSIDLRSLLQKDDPVL